MLIGENMEEKTPKRKIRLWIKVVVVLILLVVGTLLYSRFISTSGLVTKEYLVVNENLPEKFYGLKIAHISDIHYGQTTRKDEIKSLVKKVNETKPDIIVITGDLLDREMKYTKEDLDYLVEKLNELEATLGKYIIMGNHDNTQEAYAEVVSSSNFTNLNDTYQILYNGDNNPILIAGISTGEYSNLFAAEKVEESIKKIKELNTSYNILIMHEPDYIEEFDYSNFQLILAGHSHNGQVRLPFIGAIILPPHAKKYYDNHYTLNDTELYVSSGVGTSTIKFRFFNRPSFNLYRIVNE